MTAASARAAFLLSRFRDLSLRFLPPAPSISSGRQVFRRERESSGNLFKCLASGVDGGELADDLVSTAGEQRRRRREYSALANVLCRVEPLDISEIGEGVSEVAKEAMKKTISSMLGLLPSDQFQVDVKVSDRPLKRLLVSSVVTGYTLWNAEYRLSLARNFEKSPVLPGEPVEEKSSCQSSVEEVGHGNWFKEEGSTSENFEFSNPAALRYIQKLEAELAASEKELEAQLEEKKNMGKDDSDLLKYLRSLEPSMVSELSQPSPEVEEIIHQLILRVYVKCFADVGDVAWNSNNFSKDFPGKKIKILDATRDYLARLLFWCMLLGHHMRGLEYRLHLSFAVGLQ